MNQIYTANQTTDVVNQVDTSPAHRQTASAIKSMDTKAKAHLDQAKKIQKEVTSQEKQAKIEQDKAQKQAMTTFKNNLTTTNKMLIKDLHQQHIADPKSLQVAYDEMNEEMISNVEDPQLAETLMLNNMLEQQSYVIKAKDEFDKIELENSKTAHQEVIESNLQTIKDQASVFYSPYDTTPENARRSLVQNSINNMTDSFNATNPDGTPVFTEKQKKAFQKEYDNAKIGGYKTQLDELYLADPEKARDYVDYVNKNSTKVMKKYGLNREQYDKIRSYNNTASRIYQENDGKINPNTGVEYTEAEKVNIVNQADSTVFDYQEMGYTKKEKDRETPALGTLIDFRAKLSELNGMDPKALPPAEKRKMMINTSKSMYEHIEKNQSGFWSKKMAINVLSDLVINDMISTGRTKINDFDRVNVYEDVYLKMLGEETPFNGTTEEVFNTVRQMYGRSKESYLKSSYPTSYNSKASNMLTPDGLQSFTPDGDNNLGINIDINSDYKLEKINGYDYRVKRDSNGDLVHMVLAN